MDYDLQIKELQEQIEKLKIERNKNKIEQMINNTGINIKFIEKYIKYLTDMRGYYIRAPEDPFFSKQGYFKITNNINSMDDIDIFSFYDGCRQSSAIFPKQKCHIVKQSFNYTNLVNSKVCKCILNLIENINRRIEKLEKLKVLV